MMNPDQPSSDTQHSDSPSVAEHDQKNPNETDQSNEEPQQNPSKNQKNKGVIKIVIAIIVLILLGLIAYGLWKAYQPKQVELQGRVETDTLHVSTKVPSRIEQIYVSEGQKVRKGQELVLLVSPEIQAKKQQAQAALQSAQALQSTAERGSQEENIDTLYANWKSVQAQAELASQTYQRGAVLYQEGVISRQRRDEIYAAQQSAKELSEAAYQQYARAKRGSTPQQKSMADAQVEIAQAALAEANALAGETKLYSPVNGTVSKTYGKPSELVATAVPVVSILEDEDVWVSLNVREDQYRSVYKAKQVSGYIPALDKTLEFKIKNIDAEGEFATIKTTRQTGGYDIRSFKLHLVPAQSEPDLKVGMSVLFKVTEVK